MRGQSPCFLALDSSGPMRVRRALHKIAPAEHALVTAASTEHFFLQRNRRSGPHATRVHAVGPRLPYDERSRCCPGPTVIITRRGLPSAAHQTKRPLLRRRRRCERRRRRGRDDGQLPAPQPRHQNGPSPRARDEDWDAEASKLLERVNVDLQSRTAFNHLDCIYQHPTTQAKLFVGNQTAARNVQLLQAENIFGSSTARK